MRALLALLALAPAALAQGPAAPRAPPVVADTGSFSPIPWPAPTPVRSASGAPGPGSWQQRVDYVIKAALDTGAQVVTGEEWISYTNNSPDTLRHLWLQLDQNLFAPRAGAAG